MIAPCAVGMSIESSPRADYCIKHKDKSLTNERIMLRLTQTPTKKHYLMLEGANGVVYHTSDSTGTERFSVAPTRLLQ